MKELMNGIPLKDVMTKDEFWIKHEKEYGRFFRKGDSSFRTFININRRRLMEDKVLLKSTFGVFVNEPLLLVEIQKRITGGFAK